MGSLERVVGSSFPAALGSAGILLGVDEDGLPTVSLWGRRGEGLPTIPDLPLHYPWGQLLMKGLRTVKIPEHSAPHPHGVPRTGHLGEPW